MTLMEIDDFDYELPTNLIAQQPPNVRGDSKLLIVNPNKTSLLDSHCKNFYDYLSPPVAFSPNNPALITLVSLKINRSLGDK